jgi:D-3-phosphoglycerate dehydrogenase
VRSGQVSVLAVGDRFVPASLLARQFAQSAAGAGIDASIREVELPYPTAPTVPVPSAAGQSIRAFWEDREGIEARLDADDADPTIREYTGPVDGLAPYMTGADVLLLHTAPVSRNTIAAADRLAVVGTVRTGPVNVNVEALSARGIPLLNTPGRNAQAVAEFVAGALISHLRHIVSGNVDLRAGRWALYPWSAVDAGFELSGKTCGVIGFGRVGRAFAPIAGGFGMRLLVSDPFVAGDDVVAAGGELVEVERLLGDSDVVVLMARLNDTNRHMIDAAALARMKPGALLVNTARSELVDTTALVDALRSGRIGGAIVDVFDQEPPLAGEGLLDAPNVLLTPHIAGATKDTVRRGAGILAEAVAAYLAEGRLINCLNADAVRDFRQRSGAPAPRASEA